MKHKALLASVLVLILSLVIGYWIACHKPLWNDEFYTAVSSVNNTSYVDQLAGHIPEGNNTPLFYIFQKSLLQLTGYKIPNVWQQGNWKADAQAQIMLRVLPVLCMSLSVALVFYYFLSSYSWILAVYSLFLYLSSYMLWVYWAEARPYALIVLLSTIQSIVFLKVLQNSKTKNTWKLLAVTHGLLALSFVFSIGQIVAVSLVLWMSKERDWKKHLFLTVIPVAIALFYYSHAPKYAFYFDLSPEQLIRDNISRERFHIFLMYTLLLMMHWISSQRNWKKLSLNNEIIRMVGYFFFLLFILLAAGSVLEIFMMHVCQPGKGFAISSRYFIYLMPIGVIAAVLMSNAIVKALAAYRWAQWLAVVLISVLVIPKFFKVVPTLIKHYLTN